LNFRQTFSTTRIQEYLKYLVQKEYKELAGLFAIVSNLPAASRLSPRSSSINNTIDNTSNGSLFTEVEKAQLKFLADHVSKKIPRIHTTSILPATTITENVTSTTSRTSNTSQTNHRFKMYLDQLKFELDARHVEWYQVDESTLSNGSSSSSSTQPLPSLETDDISKYPSTLLGDLRGKKLSLDECFGTTVDAVII
jgi:hypothetical protein